MIDRIKKYAVVGLVIALIVVMGKSYYDSNRFQDKINKLHNEIALNAKTIEVQKQVYAKQVQTTDDLNDVVKAMLATADRDKEQIKSLLAELKKRDEELLTANRIAVKWKKAYQGMADASQEDVITGDDEEMRKKVDFERDFGYIGVSGWTLTDPPEAWVNVEQKRPLQLTLAVAQGKDGRWNSYVTSSEENVDVDIQLSGVNPYVFKKKWWEKFSIDIGAEVSNGFYPYAAVTYPISGIDLSVGGFYDADEEGFGLYLNMRYSWNPF